MKLDELLGDGESEAEAAVASGGGGVGLSEAVEDGEALDDMFVGAGGLGAEDLGPAQDRVEGGAQLVAERGEELVLHPPGAFGVGAGGAFGVEQAFALPGYAAHLLLGALAVG